MHITVVVPTLHAGPRLRRLLQSLAAQTVAHDTIVVDNGSGERLQERYPDVDVVTVDGNLGFGPAVNLAARLEQNSTPGQILLSDATAQAAADAECAMRPHPPLTVKNRVQPVPVYEIEWRPASAPTEAVPLAAG